MPIFYSKIKFRLEIHLQSYHNQFRCLCNANFWFHNCLLLALGLKVSWDDTIKEFYSLDIGRQPEDVQTNDIFRILSKMWLFSWLKHLSDIPRLFRQEKSVLRIPELIEDIQRSHKYTEVVKANHILNREEK